MAMNTQDHTYNADEVSAVFFDIPIQKGWADGEFLKLEKVEDDVATVVSTDGTVTVYKVNNPLWNITLTLIQTSDFNKAFNAARKLAMATGNTVGQGRMVVKDGNNNSIRSNRIWLKKPAPITYDRMPTPRAYEFQGIIPPENFIIGGV
jgi:hypothetical protein